MRIGEVFKFTAADIENIRITLWNPKSSSEQEAVFIPKHVAGRVETYIRKQEIGPDERISPLTSGDYILSFDLVNSRMRWF